MEGLGEQMRLVSLFAGIGGIDRAFERAGFETLVQCDLFDAGDLTDAELGEPCGREHWERRKGEPVLVPCEVMAERQRRELTSYGGYLREVLTKHWPDVWRVNDVRNIPDAARELAQQLESGDRGQYVDCVAFGSPCQDLSVAGKRGGLAAARSGLFFAAIDAIRELRPEFALWENVPGALSSNGGRDFVAVLAAFADAGATDIAWRVLDAQWFGVPQRRRRVFVVADFGGQRAAEILSVPSSGERHPQARGEAGQGVAYSLAASARGTGDGHGNAWNTTYVANPVTASAGHHGHGSPRGDGSDNLVVNALDGQQGGADDNSAQANHLVAAPLSAANGHKSHSGGRRREDDVNIVAIQDARGVREKAQHGWGITEDGPMYTVDGVSQHAVFSGGVRRLTPRECERLMGLPDDWTRWGDGREIPDSVRYMMIGNSVAVPCVEWIARNVAAAVGQNQRGGGLDGTEDADRVG